MYGDAKMIASRMTEVMDRKDIKPIELSRRTGIPKGSISQYMSGYAAPKADRISLIARALGVSEAWLLGYDVEMIPQKRTYITNEEIKDILADGLSEEETIIIKRYRQADEHTQEMVYRLLSYCELIKKEVTNGEA